MEDRFINKKTVRFLTTYSYTEIQRKENEGRFPRRIRLGTGRYCRVVWLESEVRAWMETQIAKARFSTQTP